MADRVLPSREQAQEAKDEGNWAGTAFTLQEAYISRRLVDREASVPIAWCYLHNAVRDHHIETERCDVPRSLLFRLDALDGDF